MRVLADENIPPALVEALRAAGHDVTSIHEGLRGSPDPIVADLSVREGRILLTYDKDFGEMLFAAPPVGTRPAGVVLLRLGGMAYSLRTARVLDVFASEELALRGHFTVVEPARTRQRALPGAATGE